MTENIDRAAEVIHDTVQEWPQDDVAGVATHRLFDAGLLAPDLSNVTRITVAGGGKRQMEEWNLHDVELHIQDEGRTLKIFYRTNIQERTAPPTMPRGWAVQTHEWEELLYEAPADHLPGKRAVAEVIRLRRAIAGLRDDCLSHIANYDEATVTHMCFGTAADELTRILEGDTDE